MSEDFSFLTNEETLLYIQKSQRGDEQAKEILINKNFPLIKSIIKRYVGFGVEYEDLYQLGCVGFLKAVENFNCDFNVKFSTYAVPMIAGEIKRFLRDDGAVKVSRSVKALASKINLFVNNYKKTKNISPSLEEIANTFQISQEDVVFAMDSTKNIVSLFEKDGSDEDGLSLIDKIVGSEGNEQILDNIILREGIKKLENREKQIVLLRFYRGATQSEVSKQLGISQVQVSRLECKIIDKLKKMF